MNDTVVESPRHAVHSSTPAYGTWTLTAIAAITAARLVWLSIQSAELYPDEAQYWFWAQHLALGYYSKPPLVAWLIALTTAIFGDGEFGVRLSAPLLHAIAAGFVWTTGARLYDRRIGFWSALAYASLPGVSLSALLISTDAVLMPCWAAALYCFIRARENGEWGWWFAAGVAIGLGFLAKYAMAYWLISAFGFVLSVRDERRHLPGLLLALMVGALIVAPNLWWNENHGFVSILHVRDNAQLSGSLFHPTALAKFVLSQFGVFGPIMLAGLVLLCARPFRLHGESARLLASFTWPTLLVALIVSLLSRAEPNWAAPAYIAAAVLVTSAALTRGWRRTLIASIALHLVAAIAIFGGSEILVASGMPVPAKYDPLHRLRGWSTLGTQVRDALAANPGLKLMADDRELLAALIYYVRPHPFDAVEWEPVPGVTDQWRLENSEHVHRGEDFLAVTNHQLYEQMRPEFAELTLLKTIAIHTGPGGGMTYALYIARGYRGPGQP
ncbi:MAG TPA: glycosyltransferase family 39 protein [Stellaceae bacterium]|nr:glycosyltransferase family 39 protein [Stellaceae bacterium]